MIYRITFADGYTDHCTAKSQLDLLKSYDSNFYMDLQDVEEIEEVSEKEARQIKMIDEGEEVSLYDMAISDDFEVLSSNRFE